MNDYKTLEAAVLKWANDRMIIPNSTCTAQAIKTHEELGELLSALHRKSWLEVRDAYGDILVTLIIGADLAGLDLVDCLALAYDQIKDRKGYLREDGVFVKEGR
ncbi:MAG: MazG-like family protein [Pseudohongiellaceae bacterium]